MEKVNETPYDVKGVQHVDKPWGSEVRWAFTNKYIGKDMYINKGHSLSLQSHTIKQETYYVREGVGVVEINDIPFPYTKGDVFTIRPTLKHRVKALRDSIITEVTTPHQDDIIRYSDEYGREDKTNE